MAECVYDDNRTLLMLSVTLLKLLLSEEAQSWCGGWVRGNLNGQIYRQNILEAGVVPHFDNHLLNTRCVFIDDNAKPHRARVVTYYLRGESITTLPWPARILDFNPIEQIWDIIGRRVKKRIPLVQTWNDLEKPLHQERQRLTQVQIRRLVDCMRRRLAAVIRVNGRYTHY